MTGYDIFLSALNLINHNGDFSANNGEEILLKKSVFTINRVLSDLTDGTLSIENIHDKIECSDAVSDALCYGVAMFLSLSEGDSNSQNVFAEIYNLKRAKAKSGKGYIKNGVLSYLN